jgi:hypothetical protein
MHNMDSEIAPRGKGVGNYVPGLVKRLDIAAWRLLLTPRRQRFEERETIWGCTSPH